MRQSRRNKITLIVLLVLSALVLYTFSSGQNAKHAVLVQLIDPDSAQFKDMQTVDTHVCGAVNSKNHFGGYTGYRRFVYIESSGTVIWEDENPPQFSDFIVRCIQSQM